MDVGLFEKVFDMVVVVVARVKILSSYCLRLLDFGCKAIVFFVGLCLGMCAIAATFNRETGHCANTSILISSRSPLMK